MTENSAPASHPEAFKPIRMQHILVPTDFSIPAERAVSHAVRLAEKTGAKLYVLHVADTPQAPPGCSGDEYVRMRDRLRRKTEGELCDLVRKHTSPGLALSYHPVALEGISHHEIIKATVEYDVDLIVIAPSGRNGFLKRTFFGSTVEKVVRYADCPVLVVREKSGELPPML